MALSLISDCTNTWRLPYRTLKRLSFPYLDHTSPAITEGKDAADKTAENKEKIAPPRKWRRRVRAVLDTSESSSSDEDDVKSDCSGKAKPYTTLYVIEDSVC